MKLIEKIKLYKAKCSTKSYVKYMKKRGVLIGDNICIRDIRSIEIDLTRPTLISIGNNVCLNRNFKLFTHDYVSGIFIHKYNDFIASSGRVVIGNNVRFGTDCIVLKGTKIGDNCFIAAGSIVTKNIPDNCIAAGIPARVICSMDEYYEKRKELYLHEAIEYAQSIQERLHRRPVIEDFWEEFPLFVDSNNIKNYPTIPIKKQLGEAYNVWIKKHKANFDGFENFLKAVGL